MSLVIRIGIRVKNKSKEDFSILADKAKLRRIK